MRWLAILLVVAVGCTKKKPKTPPPEIKPPPRDEQKLKRAPGEPDRVEISFILLCFKGSHPATKATRSRDEARGLAEELLESARKPGSDFQGLVDQYSEPQFHNPGVLGIVNYEVQRQGNEQARLQLRSAWGSSVTDALFRMKEGEVVLVPHDARTAKFGFWLVKRMK